LTDSVIDIYARYVNMLIFIFYLRSIDSIVGYTGSFDNILNREHLYRIIV
jgi:hypothetical protein